MASMNEKNSFNKDKTQFKKLKIYHYAQTNIQLFKELMNLGYSTGELVLIKSAYELARNLLTGKYFASSRAFIDHAVGTASILASLRLSADVVAAGLLHNIYREGDFGFGAKNHISDSKRKKVISIVGRQVEKYISKYLELPWYKNLPAICANLDKLDKIDRDVVLIKLANELEHILDFEHLYFPDADKHLKRINHNCPIMIEIAEKMGLEKLADEIRTAFRQFADADLPLELLSSNFRNTYFVLAPLSYRKRYSVLFYQILEDVLNYSRYLLVTNVRRLRSHLNR